MKSFTELELAKAIFTENNHKEICKKAELSINCIPNSIYDKVRDIMWGLEDNKRVEAHLEAKAIYKHGNDIYINHHRADSRSVSIRQEENRINKYTIGPCFIQPNEMLVLNVQPQLPFKFKGICLTDTRSLPHYFQISKITIGLNIMLECAPSISLLQINDYIDRIKSNITVCNVGMIISIYVQNIDNKSHYFTADVFGISLE